MSKLKIVSVEDDKPVTMTIKLPAAVHRDLIIYVEILAQQSGQSIKDPSQLIAPMVARFMATDRAFMRGRRLRQNEN